MSDKTIAEKLMTKKQYMKQGRHFGEKYANSHSYGDFVKLSSSGGALPKGIYQSNNALYGKSFKEAADAVYTKNGSKDAWEEADRLNQAENEKQQSGEAAVPENGQTLLTRQTGGSTMMTREDDSNGMISGSGVRKRKTLLGE